MTMSAAGTASESAKGQQGGGAPAAAGEKLGFRQGQVVQEIGWDEDVDDAFREAVEALVEGPLEDEDYDGGADAVVLWWRDGDGDLIDDVVDALSDLAEGGFIVLMTPKTGREGFVEPSDIAEAATVSGLVAATGVPCGTWLATRLGTPKGGRR